MNDNASRLASRIELLEQSLLSALERIAELESTGTTIATALTRTTQLLTIQAQFIRKFDLESDAAEFSRQFEQEAKGLQ